MRVRRLSLAADAQSLDTGRSSRMRGVNRLLGIAVLSITLAGPLSGQGTASARQLSAGQTGCNTSQRVAPDSVYESHMVDEPVEAERLPIEDMPLRVREVLSGRSVFRWRPSIAPCGMPATRMRRTPAWPSAARACARPSRAGAIYAVRPRPQAVACACSRSSVSCVGSYPALNAGSASYPRRARI